MLLVGVLKRYRKAEEEKAAFYRKFISLHNVVERQKQQIQVDFWWCSVFHT